MGAFNLRAGSAEDDPAVHELFRDSVEDLLVRIGLRSPGPPDLAARKARWDALYRPLMAHLSTTAEAYQIAEDEAGLLGYGRTINRGGLRELTELFVYPRAQGLGIGRKLMERCFPRAGAETLAIIATLDVRAQNRYLQSGCYPEFPLISMLGQPHEHAPDSALRVEPIDPSGADANMVAAIDEAVLGHRRDVDHAWLATHRPGWRYYRGRQLVGYGFVGPTSGPVAALDPNDMAPILKHLETMAAKAGITELAWDVPGISRAAIAHLSSAGFKVENWFTFFMCNHSFGRFDRYVVSGPTFFL